METEEKLIRMSLSQKLLALFFILLVIDFALYVIFGQSYHGDYSLGRSIFVVMSIVAAFVFVAFLIALIAEFVSSYKKKDKNNSNYDN